MSTAHTTFTAKPWRSRLLIACLFWMLCLTLSAAGHRLYKATVTLDRRVSAVEYRADGARLVWVGHGPIEDSWQSAAGTTPPERGRHVLPNSRFWLAATLFLSAAGALMVWSGRWISSSGIQSLVGLLAGHLLWIGPIELGLEAAGRELGLAGSVEMVGERPVGTHAAGTLIRLSAAFLVPVLIGLTLHESNRCAVFQWIRRRLPILCRPSPSGRVENYAARTAIQFFMTVWCCYVGVLWLAEPATGAIGRIGLLLALPAIIVATPYMVWRTACQPNAARALRYAVSGAVITWTAIEIAASMQLLREPWLSGSRASGIGLLLLSVGLSGLAAHRLREGRSQVKSGVLALMCGVSVCLSGCHRTHEPEPSGNAEIEQQLEDYERRIGPPPAEAADGLLHALGSTDPQMRAQAAIAWGKSRQVSPLVRESLEAMAHADESPLARRAAERALQRLDRQRR